MAIGTLPVSMSSSSGTFGSVSAGARCGCRWARWLNGTVDMTGYPSRLCNAVPVVEPETFGTIRALPSYDDYSETLSQTVREPFGHSWSDQSL